MAVIRGPKDRNFAVMCEHHLRNKNLSLKAIGLFSIILSLPPNWDYSIAGLATITKDGITAVRGALNELEANGYLIRRRLRSPDGRLERNEYTFYEIPLSPPECTVPPEDPEKSPQIAPPIRENPMQVYLREYSIDGKKYRWEEI